MTWTEIVLLSVLKTVTITNPYISLDQKDMTCLAENIYHEGRGESIEGQIAIAQVTLRRANAIKDKNPKEKNSVCKAVHTPGAFSWTKESLAICKKKSLCPKPGKIEDKDAWLIATEIAIHSTSGMIAVDYSNGALYYYNPEKSNPEWAKKMTIVAHIDNHVFLDNQ